MAAAVPFAVKAGAALGGAALGKLLNRPNQAQQAATQGTSALAAAMPQYAAQQRGMGTGAIQQGMGSMGAATDYYRRILGTRSGANAALAPERSTALDYYRGAGTRISNSVQGPQRDTQLAELDRQKVGQLANMTGQARAGAATGLADIGSKLTGLGTTLTGQGNYADVNALYGQQAAFNQQDTLRQHQQESGNTWGSFIYDLMKTIPAVKKRTP